MNKIKVKTLVDFYDRDCNTLRIKDDVFEISIERLEEINHCEYCKKNNTLLVEEINENIKEKKTKSKNKK